MELIFLKVCNFKSTEIPKIHHSSECFEFEFVLYFLFWKATFEQIGHCCDPKNKVLGFFIFLVHPKYCGNL